MSIFTDVGLGSLIQVTWLNMRTIVKFCRPYLISVELKLSSLVLFFKTSQLHDVC